MTFHGLYLNQSMTIILGRRLTREIMLNLEEYVFEFERQVKVFREMNLENLWRVEKFLITQILILIKENKIVFRKVRLLCLEDRLENLIFLTETIFHL